MKQWKWMLAASMAIVLSGCVLNGKQHPVVRSTPPPPAPTPAAVTPTPRPQPLSIPQTQAQLPPAQPISPEALATTQVQPQPVETQAEPRPPRKPPVTVNSPRATEPPAAQPTAAPTPPVETEQRPPVQEIVPAGEAKRLQESAGARKQEIRRLLEQAQARGLTRDQRSQVVRIQSFMQLSDDAEKRGNMREADALAERAQLLARELQK